MLDTLFSGPEYISVAKHTGIYSELLQWRAAVQRGDLAHWPGVAIPAPLPERSSALATVAPQKRALDYLHEAYDLLGLDDGAPLTMEALKIAYKKSALRAHPDKGGSPALFDAVSRAYTYIEEILNKLIPRAAGRATDAPVTMEQAVAYRATPVRPLSNTLSHDGGAPSLRVEDAPPVSLNAKSLNMTVFNKLFDEHRLPNPDEDGYGDWLKSSGEEHSRKGVEELRTKFNADKFRSVFQEEIAAKPRDPWCSRAHGAVPTPAWALQPAGCCATSRRSKKPMHPSTRRANTRSTSCPGLNKD
jgi:curved DNA-binding protein CbpA